MTILKKPIDSLLGETYYGGKSGRCPLESCRQPILGSLTVAGTHYRLCGGCGRAWREEGGYELTRELLERF